MFTFHFVFILLAVVISGNGDKFESSHVNETIPGFVGEINQLRKDSTTIPFTGTEVTQENRTKKNDDMDYDIDEFKDETKLVLHLSKSKYKKINTKEVNTILQKMGLKKLGNRYQTTSPMPYSTSTVSGLEPKGSIFEFFTNPDFTAMEELLVTRDKATKSSTPMPAELTTALNTVTSESIFQSTIGSTAGNRDTSNAEVQSISHTTVSSIPQYSVTPSETVTADEKIRPGSEEVSAAPAIREEILTTTAQDFATNIAHATVENTSTIRQEMTSKFDVTTGSMETMLAQSTTVRGEFQVSKNRTAVTLTTGSDYSIANSTTQTTPEDISGTISEFLTTESPEGTDLTPAQHDSTQTPVHKVEPDFSLINELTTESKTPDVTSQPPVSVPPHSDLSSISPIPNAKSKENDVSSTVPNAEFSPIENLTFHEYQTQAGYTQTESTNILAMNFTEIPQNLTDTNVTKSIPTTQTQSSTKEFDEISSMGELLTEKAEQSTKTAEKKASDASTTTEQPESAETQSILLSNLRRVQNSDILPKTHDADDVRFKRNSTRQWLTDPAHTVTESITAVTKDLISSTEDLDQSVSISPTGSRNTFNPAIETDVSETKESPTTESVERSSNVATQSTYVWTEPANDGNVPMNEMESILQSSSPVTQRSNLQEKNTQTNGVNSPGQTMSEYTTGNLQTLSPTESQLHNGPYVETTSSSTQPQEITGSTPEEVSPLSNGGLQKLLYPMDAGIGRSQPLESGSQSVSGEQETDMEYSTHSDFTGIALPLTTQKKIMPHLELSSDLNNQTSTIQYISSSTTDATTHSGNDPSIEKSVVNETETEIVSRFTPQSPTPVLGLLETQSKTDLEDSVPQTILFTTESFATEIRSQSVPESNEITINHELHPMTEISSDASGADNRTAPVEHATGPNYVTNTDYTAPETSTTDSSFTSIHNSQQIKSQNTSTAQNLTEKKETLFAENQPLRLLQGILQPDKEEILSGTDNFTTDSSNTQDRFTITSFMHTSEVSSTVPTVTNVHTTQTVLSSGQNEYSTTGQTSEQTKGEPPQELLDHTVTIDNIVSETPLQTLSDLIIEKLSPASATEALSVTDGKMTSEPPQPLTSTSQNVNKVGSEIPLSTDPGSIGIPGQGAIFTPNPQSSTPISSYNKIQTTSTQLSGIETIHFLNYEDMYDKNDDFDYDISNLDNTTIIFMLRDAEDYPTMGKEQQPLQTDKKQSFHSSHKSSTTEIREKPQLTGFLLYLLKNITITNAINAKINKRILEQSQQNLIQNQELIANSRSISDFLLRQSGSR